MHLFVQQITVRWKPPLEVNYTGSLLPGYPTGTRVPAAALHSVI